MPSGGEDEPSGPKWWEGEDALSTASGSSTSSKKKKKHLKNPFKRKKKHSKEATATAVAPAVATTTTTAAAAMAEPEPDPNDPDIWKRYSWMKQDPDGTAAAGSIDSRETQRAEASARREQRRQELQQQQQRQEQQQRQQQQAAARRNDELEDDHPLGCCHNCFVFLVKCIHYTDMIFGIILVVYGILIYVEPPKNTLREASAVTGWFGFLLLFSSLAGNFSFWTGCCKRCGLAISAWLAPVIGLCELTALIGLWAAKDIFFNYLRRNKEKLLMSDGTINNLHAALPFFYILLIVFMAVEFARFFITRRLRQNLLEKDEIISEEREVRRSREREQRQAERQAKWDNFWHWGKKDEDTSATVTNENWAQEPLLDSGSNNV